MAFFRHIDALILMVSITCYLVALTLRADTRKTQDLHAQTASPQPLNPQNPGPAKIDSLRSMLDRLEAHDPNQRVSNQQQRAITEQIKQIDQLYSPQFSQQLMVSDDQSQSALNPQLTRLRQASLKGQISQYWSSGTRIHAGWSLRSIRVESAGLDISPGLSAPGSDESNLNNDLTIGIQQELGRRMETEVEWDRAALRAQKPVLEADYQRQLQQRKAQAGEYFIQASWLKTQLTLMRRRVETSKVYERQVKEQVNFGRLDKTQQITAENTRLLYEGDVLENQHQLQEALHNLSRLLYPTPPFHRIAQDSIPTLGELSITDIKARRGASRPTQADRPNSIKPDLGEADIDEPDLSQRWDIKALRLNEEPLRARLSKIQHQDTTSYTLFTEWKTTGHEPNLIDSLSETTTFSKGGWSIGVRIQSWLNDPRPRAAAQEFVHRQTALREQARQIEWDIGQRLNQNSERRRRIKARLEQLQQQEAVFAGKMREERQRIEQARSDGYILSRYEIESLQIQLQILQQRYLEKRRQWERKVLQHAL